MAQHLLLVVAGVGDRLGDRRAVRAVLTVRLVAAGVAPAAGAGAAAAARRPATARRAAAVRVRDDLLVSVAVTAAAARRPAAAAGAAAAAQLADGVAEERGSRDGNGQHGQQQSLLGDDGNAEQSDDSQHGELNLQQTQQRQQLLEDLLLLAALLDDQAAHRLLQLLGDGSGQRARGAGKVPAQRALGEEVGGAVEEEVLQGGLAGLDAGSGLDLVGGVVQGLAGTLGGLGQGEAAEQVNVLLLEEGLGATEDLYGCGAKRIERATLVSDIAPDKAATWLAIHCRPSTITHSQVQAHMLRLHCLGFFFALGSH